MYGLVLCYRNVDLDSNDLVGSMICPTCGKEIGITGDQLRGEVSVVCPHCPEGGFHVVFKDKKERVPLRYIVRWD